MALVPLSLIFELMFFFFAMNLWRENVTLERLVAVGLLLFEIPLLTAPQQFFTETGGVLALTSASIPATPLDIFVFADFLLVFIALYRWWSLYDIQRNMKRDRE